MNLDQVTLEIRPRSAWEAVDLGLLMAKRWWLPMMKVWLLASAPFFALALFIPATYFWAAFLVLWWFKPLYERPLLHILSRAVFNELPSTHSSLQQFPRLALQQIFMSLTLRRFSPTRAMDLPVVQLEGLAGARRQARISLLHREDSAPAGWLSFIGLQLEIYLALGMISLLWSMIPSEVEIEWANLFFNQQTAQLKYLQLALWYLALGLTAPFYVACGFALYLNRRIKLEAWDIDIAFRRIAEKRKHMNSQSPLISTLVALLLCSGLAGTMPNTSYADEALPVMESSDTSGNNSDSDSDSDKHNAPAISEPTLEEYQELTREQARDAITQVMQGSEFSRKEIKRRLTYIEPEEKENWLTKYLDEKFGDFFKDWDDFRGFGYAASALEIALWGAVLLLIALLVYRYRHWLAAQYVRIAPPKTPRVIPQTLFGMEVTRESLPEDIGQSAQQLLAQGNSRAALALLYRASLFQLIHRGVDIHEGHTEGECVQLMIELFSQDAPLHKNQNQNNQSMQIDYFAKLTRHWQQLAYGHQLPPGSLAEQLCNEWNACWLADQSAATKAGVK
ncbi:DUF4129 domain-containing protein [Cellvibrio fontiphilus]|uniref:DUF4129 domain-containing protein n=1 Tax=Cellvibrio fontiphilus TaxID=1815559 RepID=A0ABV7FHA2_9GAMM